MSRLVNFAPFAQEDYREAVDPDLGPGIATKKRFHIDKRFPPWLRMIAPKSGSCLEEEAHNSFPRTKTSLTLPMFSKFRIRVQTIHVDNDRGEQHNIHGLDAGALKRREVIIPSLLPLSLHPFLPPFLPSSLPPCFFNARQGRFPRTRPWKPHGATAAPPPRLLHTVCRQAAAKRESSSCSQPPPHGA